MLAIGAVMGKLFHIVYGVLKNQHEFPTKPNYKFLPITGV